MGLHGAFAMLAGFVLAGLIGCLVGAPGVVLGKTAEISEPLYEGGLDRLPPVPPTRLNIWGHPPLVSPLKQRHWARPWGQLDTATDEVAVRDRDLASNSRGTTSSWRLRLLFWH